MSRQENRSTSTTAGCGCVPLSAGGVVAFIISWKLFHLFWWALLAACFGWIYVIYAVIYYLPQIKAMLG